jgi:hypothetical protein
VVHRARRLTWGTLRLTDWDANRHATSIELGTETATRRVLSSIDRYAVADPWHGNPDAWHGNRDANSIELDRSFRHEPAEGHAAGPRGMRAVGSATLRRTLLDRRNKGALDAAGGHRSQPVFSSLCLSCLAALRRCECHLRLTRSHAGNGVRFDAAVVA